MAIQAEKGDAVARFHPCFPQSPSQTPGTFRELRVREPLVPADHSGLAGELLFGIAQESYGGKRNIHRLSRPYHAD
jgi:hypothetical protein